MSALASQVYNSLNAYMKQQAKNDLQITFSFIDQYNMDETTATHFKQLINTNGQYKLPATSYNSNKLQKEKEKIESKENKKLLKSTICWHPKLMNLSCVKNPTNGDLNIKRREVAMMLNENVNLDNISSDRVHKIVVEIGNIKTNLQKMRQKLNMLYVKKLIDLNIKRKIETNKGRNKKGGGITKCIDQLSFNFRRWNKDVVKWDKKVLDEITKINNVIIQLKLGIFNKSENKFVATLTVREYDIKTNLLVSKDQGRTIFDYVMNEKREFIEFKKKLNEYKTQIDTKRKNKLYSHYLKDTTEEERARRHKKANTNKNDNQNKKKGKIKKKKKNPVEANKKSNNILSFFGKKRQRFDGMSSPPLSKRFEPLRL